MTALELIEEVFKNNIDRQRPNDPIGTIICATEMMEAAPKLAQMLKVAIDGLEMISPEHSFVTATQNLISVQTLKQIDQIAGEQ